MEHNQNMMKIIKAYRAFEDRVLEWLLPKSMLAAVRAQMDNITYEQDIITSRTITPSNSSKWRSNATELRRLMPIRLRLENRLTKAKAVRS